MAISRRRAKLIHEINGYACWATVVALFLRVTFMEEQEGADMITAAMLVGLVSMVAVYFLLPPVPAQRRRQPRKRRTTTYRGNRKRKTTGRRRPAQRRRKGWNF
jgi:hypothetical protein